ncbi:MAG: amidohydrolase family protein [Actinomycetota bacterium]|nr:amidohydrolase family protein [Actinomycetota bacterium]
MVIDAYSHACPRALIEALERVHPTAEARALRTNSYQWDTDRRRRYMDRIGVDTQVLVLVRPPMWLGMARPDVHELTRVANDGLAAMASEDPDRFIGVGVLPVVDEVTMVELDRLRVELGLAGVLIFSNVEGEPLDADAMWPLYEYAAAHSFPIWIHPQHGHSYPWLSRDLVDRIFGWPFETSIAMARLVFGGVLERFPEIKFVTHHLGGMVPYYSKRIEGMSAEVARYGSLGIGGQSPVQLTGSVVDHFRRFYNDSMVNDSPSAMSCGLDFFGADHVMYGTDFPMGPNDGEDWPVEVLETIRALDISEADRELVLAGNLLRLIGRPG